MRYDKKSAQNCKWEVKNMCPSKKKIPEIIIFGFFFVISHAINDEFYEILKIIE